MIKILSHFSLTDIFPEMFCQLDFSFRRVIFSLQTQRMKMIITEISFNVHLKMNIYAVNDCNVTRGDSHINYSVYPFGYGNIKVK